MPKLPIDDWSDWISALIKNIPLDNLENTEDISAIGKAKKLLAAIDQGGIPTDPVRINNIGRSLGLEVSPNAPMAETIDRIRDIVNKD